MSIGKCITRYRNTKLVTARSAVAAAALFACSAAYGDVITAWNFNSGNTNPSTGSGILTTVGGVSQSFAGGSPNDVTGSALNTAAYPAQSTANKTAGIQMLINTSGFSLTTFSFDWQTSNTASRYLELQYTTNGSTWVDGNQYMSTVGGAFNPTNTFDFTTLTAASNNAAFGIRLVTSFAPNGFTENAIAYGPNAAYQSANPLNTSTYSTGGTQRFDLLTLNGTVIQSNFVATNLTWNSSSGTWDTNTANKPWLNPSNVPSPFSQDAVGHGDNVTFNNPAANSIVTVQASGVTPNSTTVTNSSTLTFTGGSIGGAGGLVKSGNGRLIIANANTFSSANQATVISAGTVETRANNALGIGTASIVNATLHSTTVNQTASGVLALTGPATVQTDSDLTLSGGIAGSGALTKTGAGTLGVGGVGTDSGLITINAGTVRMDNQGALGGNAVTGTPIAPVINLNNANLVTFGIGTTFSTSARYSGIINLNNGTISRAQLTANPAPSVNNGSTVFAAYDGAGTASNGYVNVTAGTSAIRNLETRTATDTNISVGNSLIFEMPVLVNTGGTLRIDAINGSLSNGTAGFISNTAVQFQTFTTDAIGPHVNDTITIQGGATLAMVGAGEKRLGAGTATAGTFGMPIVGRGGASGEAILKADARTFMTDAALLRAAGDHDAISVNTNLVVAGTGTLGLRVEAPMNADYTPTATFTSGLFGINTGTSSSSLASSYTVLSPARYAALNGFTNQPTAGVDGAPITRGGTLTVAATDAAGATGTIDNGPATGSAIKLGLDNTAASGALVYQVDPSAAGTGANFANFNGLVLKKTGAASVTTKLLANATLNGTSPAATTLEHLGGTLDLNNKSLTVGVATLSNGTITNSASGIGTLSASTITKNTTSNFRVGPRARLNGGLNVSAGTLTFTQSGTSNSTSKVSSLTIGAAAAVDLTDNDLIIGAGTSKAQVFTYLKNGYDFGNFDGVAGLTTSLGLAGNNNTTLGLLDADEYANNNGSPTFDGYAVASTDKLVKYTYFGDVDFNGAVDSTDYNIIDFGFLTGASGWANGDVDYSGAVDSSDYNNIDFAFVSQNGALRRAISYLEGADRSTHGMGDESLQEVIKHYDEFGDVYAAGFLAHVPEPTSLAVVTLAAGALMGRRRRRNA